MAEQNVNSQNNVNLNDAVFQVTLAKYVEMGMPNVDKDLPIFKFMGSVGNIAESGNANNGERLRYALNEISFPTQTGAQTIHHRKPQQRPVQWDEAVFNKQNTRPTERVSFTYGPRQVSSVEGYPLGDDFYESLLPVNRIPDIIEGLSRDYASLMGEFVMAKISGRLGDTNQGGWQTFVGEESGHDASGSDAMGDSGARTTHPSFDELNVENTFDQPSDYLSPATANFDNTRAPVPQMLTSASTMSYEFLTKVLNWARKRENDQIRGIGFMPAKMMKMQERQEGGYTKVPGGTSKGCIIISHDVATGLTQDSDWLEAQRAMAGDLGAHTGWSTGDVGSISGYSLWQSHKVVQFNAGASGTVKAHRCLMLGKGGAMLIRYKPTMLPQNWDGIIRQRNYLPRGVPAMAPSMRLYIDKQMAHRSIFWQSWINARIVTWPMNYKGYKKVNNVVAIDVAADAV